MIFTFFQQLKLSKLIFVTIFVKIDDFHKTLLLIWHINNFTIKANQGYHICSDNEQLIDL